MDRYLQFLVDGPYQVLFLWELKQPGLGGYFCGLCGLEDFVPCIMVPLTYAATYWGPCLWLMAGILSVIRNARDEARYVKLLTHRPVHLTGDQGLLSSNTEKKDQGITRAVLGRSLPMSYLTD